MTAFSPDDINGIVRGLEIRPVLEYLNYRVDSIQETAQLYRCFCPIHREQVLRTLIIDKKTRKAKCSFTNCPGRAGGDLVDLLALSKGIGYNEALAELAAHFRLGPGASPVKRAGAHPAPQPTETIPAPRSASAETVLSAAKATEEIGQGVDDLCARAERLAGSGDHEAASECYRQVLEEDPKRDDIRLKCIEALVHADYEPKVLEQISAITNAFVEEENAALALVHLEGFLRQHRDSPAISEKMLEIYRRFGRGPDVAEVFISCGDYEHAAQILQRLLRFDPNETATAEMLADCRVKLGARPQALLSYQSLADLYGEQGLAERQLNVLLKIAALNPADTRTLQQILTLYEALNLPVDAQDIRRRMAQLYFERKAYGKALEICHSVLRTDATDAVVREQMLQIYAATRKPGFLRKEGSALLDDCLRSGDSERVQRILGLLVSNLPLDDDVLSNLIQKISEEGDWNDAVPVVQRVIDGNVEAGHIAESFAFLRRLLDRGTDASRLFPLWMGLCARPKVLEKNWPQVEQVFQALETRKQRDLLTRMLRDLAELEPDFQPAADCYIAHLESLGLKQEATETLRRWARQCVPARDMEGAFRHYHRATEISPNDVDLWHEFLEFRVAAGIREGTADMALRLASLLEDQGLPGQAMHVLKTTLDIEPDRNDLRLRLQEIEALAADLDEMRGRYLAVSAQQIENKEYAAARSTLTEAIGRLPLDLEFRRCLIDLFRTMNLPKEASAEMGNVATIQADAGQFESALKLLDEVSALNPDNLRTQALRAEIHARMGEKALALQEFRALAARPESEGASPSSAAAPTAADSPPVRIEGLPIKAEYSFEQFVVGPNNNFAYATCLAIAKNPGQDFNPLFLYGDVGLGKTHLLHAIANHLMSSAPNQRLLYTSGKEFTNDLIDAIQNNTIREFRAIHKSADVLLIDDIHFLAGQERVQEEFFQIFNTLFQASRQIVMTSDRPPRELAHLEKRLRSRFGGGVIVDIRPPDLETRAAILRRDAQSEGIVVDEQVLAVIAERIDTNVRDLKGALKHIVARMRIAKEEVTVETARQIIDVILGRPEGRPQV